VTQEVQDLQVLKDPKERDLKVHKERQEIGEQQVVRDLKDHKERQVVREQQDLKDLKDLKDLQVLMVEEIFILMESKH
jgi:hypothetical protein